jgi:hypothetical protein
LTIYYEFICIRGYLRIDKPDNLILRFCDKCPRHCSNGVRPSLDATLAQRLMLHKKSYIKSRSRHHAPLIGRVEQYRMTWLFKM